MAVRSETTTKHEHVGLIGEKERRDIAVTDYSALWPEVFHQHARIIRDALGDTALRIEHIGSTSVPSLAAKPIIDILVVVPNAADEPSYLPAMLSAGYELRVREPNFDEHRMLRTRERDVHVHIFPPTSKEIGRYLAFRDRLRTSTEDRAWYEQTKRKLAVQSWEDMNAYANAKSKVVEAIICKALQADATGRSP